MMKTSKILSNISIDIVDNKSQLFLSLQIVKPVLYNKKTGLKYINYNFIEYSCYSKLACLLNSS